MLANLKNSKFLYALKILIRCLFNRHIDINRKYFVERYSNTFLVFKQIHIFNGKVDTYEFIMYPKKVPIAIGEAQLCMLDYATNDEINRYMAKEL